MIIIFDLFHYADNTTTQKASLSGIHHGTLDIVTEVIIWSIGGLIKQYEVPLFTNFKRHSEV